MKSDTLPQSSIWNTIAKLFFETFFITIESQIEP
jgi:hypothetical protein